MSDQKQQAGQTQPTRPAQPAQTQQQQQTVQSPQQPQHQQPNGASNNNSSNTMQVPVASLQQAPTPVPPSMQQQAMSVAQHQLVPQAVMTPGPVPTPGVMPIAAATPQPMQVPQPSTPLQMAPGTTIRSTMPQQVSLSQMPGVQVIQQPIHSPPYLQPFYNQQFQMFQNAAVQGIHQAMQVSSMNPQMGLAVQGRPPSVGPKSPTMIAPVPPTSQVQVQMKPPGSSTSSPTPGNGSNKATGLNGKPGTAPPNPQQQQQAQRMQGTIMQRPQSQPVVIGQVGMMNQICSSQQMMVTQPKSPIVSIAPSSQPQMINGGQPLRFTTQPTFVTNNGQIIAGANSALVGNQVLGHLQAMAATLATQNMPLGQQQILATQTPTLIGNPPLYIRAAPPSQLQPQQGIVGTVQPAQPVQQTPIANIQQAPIQQQQAIMPQPQQQQAPQQQQQQQTPIQPILKSKAEMVTNSTTTPIRATLNQATRPINAAPTQKVVGQAQKVLTPANKQGIPQNRTGPKGAVIPINQKPVLAKQNVNANQRTPPSTTQSHPGYERMAHVHPSPATNNAKQIVASLNRPAGTVRVAKPRGRPPKTVGNTPLVNGSVTVPVSQPKTSTGQGNQPPPLLVPIPAKQPLEVKNEERKASPPTLEPVNTKTEVVKKPPAVPPTKTDSSTQVVTKKPTKKPEEQPSPPKMETSTEKPAEKPPTTAPSAGTAEKQKAIVKPQVLTHVIEGFVIQEAQEPFPVQRSSLLTDFMTPNAEQARRSRSESKEKEKEKRERHAKEVEEKHDEQDEEKEQLMDEDSEPSTEPAECSPEHMPSPKIPEQTSPTLIETHTTPLLKCEYCGKIDKESRFGGSKRFCTTSCAKRYNVGRRTGLFRGRNSKNQQSHQRKRPYPTTSKRKRSSESRHGPKSPSSYQQPPTTSSHQQHLPMEQEDDHSNSMSETTTTSQEESSEPRSPNPAQQDAEMPPEPARGSQAAHSQWFGMRNPPAQWTVQDVCDFIRSMPDCVAYADAFRQQEIDGQALMLLKEDHLMQAMSMKLGPALKICEKIRKIKGEIP